MILFVEERAKMPHTVKSRFGKRFKKAWCKVSSPNCSNSGSEFLSQDDGLSSGGFVNWML